MVCFRCFFSEFRFVSKKLCKNLFLCWIWKNTMFRFYSIFKEKTKIKFVLKNLIQEWTTSSKKKPYYGFFTAVAFFSNFSMFVPKKCYLELRRIIFSFPSKTFTIKNILVFFFPFSTCISNFFFPFPPHSKNKNYFWRW